MAHVRAKIDARGAFCSLTNSLVDAVREKYHAAGGLKNIVTNGLARNGLSSRATIMPIARR